MKNFNEVHPEDRGFILGESTLHWRPVPWREYGKWVDQAVEEQKAREKAMKAMTAAGGEDTTPLIESLERVVERISFYLVPEDRAAFMKESDKASMLQLNELATWLQEEQANSRPTEPPAASGPGPGRTAVLSQVG